MIPTILYGTAWKEERTRALTEQALATGYRAIDTANQRKHYFEAGVGEAIAASGLDRSHLFLQTKFTYVRGQDHRLPYDPRADLSTQVAQSCARSLEHLGTTYLDSYILHGPWADGWNPADDEVWAAMTALHRTRTVRALGVSNVDAGQLAALIARAEVGPTFVQNRCYARMGWDRAVRAICHRHDVTYQGFSLLTANRAELQRPAISSIADRHGVTVAQVVFAFARALGILPLTGTSSVEHLRDDLAALELQLTADEIAVLSALGD
jgi:diketogulonate reductase-like aldo/keto reductase